MESITLLICLSLLYLLARHSESVEMIYMIVEAMGQPMSKVLLECKDNDGNLPIHIAAASQCSVDVLKEMVFSSLESVRITNKYVL